MSTTKRSRATSGGQSPITIEPHARRVIFEAMCAMAWADARIEREEVLAVQAAGRVLAIADDALDALDDGPPSIAHLDVDSLGAQERRLCYLCAAWLACVDAREQAVEDQLLEELRAVLAIDPVDATSLRDDARVLRATAPASLRWHEELEQLIEDAAIRVSRY